MSFGFCVANNTPKPNARACFIRVISGCLDGGFAVGGRYPYTSSMYSSARNDVVPDCLRIQFIVSFTKLDTKNMRSASPKWAIEKIAKRGLPSGVYKNLSRSSGSPAIHDSNPGEANRLFRAIANPKRSLEG